MGEQLDTLMRPDAIAVIGASDDPAKWGNRLVRNTVALGYRGRLWAVNPRHQVSIEGSDYAAEIGAIDTEIDVAIAAVPRTAALDVVRECAAHGVRNLVLPASGFGEMGEEGAAQERQILLIARNAGMRILGPNCFGLYSFSGAFNATPFAPIPHGDIALVSQSGNVAGHAFMAAQQRSLGFSHVVGLGNQLDLSFADVVDWLSRDEDTRRVALYLEGLRDRDADEFLESVANCRDAGKAVVVIKAGGSAAGRAVARSHTGSLVTEDRVWEEVLKRAGAMRVHSVEDMFGVLGLAGRARPRDRRVAIMTDGGGDSIMAVDGVERHGLQLAEFPTPVQLRLDEVIPPAAPRIPGRNPITLDTAGGVDDDPEVIPRCLEVLEGVDGIDVVVVGGLYGTYTHVRAGELRAADLILAIAERGMHVVVHSPIPVEHSEPLQVLQAAGVPVFADMDGLLRALALWLPMASRSGGQEEIESADSMTGVPSQWAADDAHAVLAAAGASLPSQFMAGDEGGLVRAAEAMGFPLCLKTADPLIVHKSDVGGVRVGITDVAELQAAARQVIESTGSPQLLVMPSLASGTEIMMGARFSPQFGAVLVVGRGGIWAEMEADTVTFVGQVDEPLLLAELSRLRCAPMLFGGRGQTPLDVVSLLPLAQALMKVVSKHPEVSVDLNPVFLYEQGYGVADLRVVEES